MLDESLVGAAGLEPATTCLEVGWKPFQETAYFHRIQFQ